VSVVANVAINVDSRSAVGSLRQVIATSEQLNASIQKLTNTLEQQQQQLNNTTKQAKSGFQSLILTLGGVTAAYANLQAAQKALQTGIQREESIRRLQFLARGYDEVTQAQLAAARAGQQFGLSTTQANQQFAQLYGRLRPLNVTLQDIETVFVGFNTAAKVSGATSAETAGAFLQLTQALGSGVLRGQELNSVLEQAPGLVVALTKELDRPVSEIRKLAEQGKITSDIVIKALQRAAKDGADELTSAMEGPSQQIKNLQNAFEEFQVAVVQNILPLTIEAVKKLTQILQDATQYVKDFGAGWTIISGAINAALAPFEGLLTILGQIDSRLRSIGQQPALNMLAGLLPGGVLSPILNAPADIGRGARKTAAGSGMFGRYAPGQNQIPFERSISNVSRGIAGGSSGGSNKAAREAERAAEAAAKEQERVSQVIRDRLAEGQMMQLRSTIQDQIAAAEMAGNEQLVVRLKGQEKQLDIEYRYAQLLAQEKDIKAQEAIIYVGNTEQVANQREIQRELNQLQNESARNQIAALQAQVGLQAQLTEGQKRMEQLRTEFAQLTNLENISITAADNIGTAFGQAFQEIINGSSSAQEALANMMRSIGENFVNMAVQIIAQQTTMVILGTILKALGIGGGGGGGFSYQGVTGNALGTSMISGNFTPTPFSTAGLGFRANGGPVSAGAPYVVGEHGPELFVPGRNGSVVSNSGLRDAMGAAPGSGSPVLNMSFQTTSIGGVEYVSRDQLEAAMAETRRQATRDGASRGMTMTLDRIKQSPQTRSRIGIR
jgi:tape measure domain-containing protein